MNTGWLSLLWFLAVLALIPVALWLLKRTPLAQGAGTPGVMRTVAVLPLSPGQRLVTVEVGSGEERRWLVLGVTAQQISTLHTMAPQADAPAAAPPAPASFAQLLRQLRSRD
ncbi:FliO/MopB family protein [Azohydromonas caseinilytica]|uniref:Flagellar biosynthetic protein FliO n=1 Tax=Azohydromonas caseinilytica TaxID=2728836 RepID=A0A848F452_9BURK|nr:flagellar biosynthetic protein FliO [Azohydromonas caseinilytica]NML14857.1 flagellar biosynthetic protein FliO [Azohydromonas caseinilytica]